MKTNTSRKSFVVRSLLVLPLTALLLFGFSEKHQIEKLDPTEKVLTLDENASPSDLKVYNELAKKYNAVPIEKRIIPLEDLKELERIYREMDKTQKEHALPFPKCLTKEYNQKAIDFIEIHINNNGKLLFQYELVPLENLKGELSKINEHLSYDQRKKMVRSVIHVEAKTPKNVIQQVDQILTEYGAATINIVGPKTSPQSSASREEMKEYNTLAKKYNEMDRNHMYIQKQEVMRLKEIYGKMSKKQQENAEPFPNFPPPPPAPDAPEPIKHAPATEAAIPSPPGVMPVHEPTSTLPAPPPPPEPKSPMEHIKEMATKGATFMHNGKEISAKEAIKVLENNKRINIDSRGSDSGKPIVKLSTEPIVIEN